MWVPEPTVLGLYVTGHVAVPVAPATREHDPEPPNSPLLSVLKLTVPVGVVGLPEVSVTVATQSSGSPMATLPGEQETVVEVVALLRAVTPRSKVPLLTL